ncbi:hypothetical protein RCPACIFIC_86 [Rhodobacter phage RcPacific]|nr:hypothetical protein RCGINGERSNAP_87 [Rhodobacter phage RcGingersnap]QXN72012.1 hypothetical protein RCPESCADO_86 [Rhodobacter phage RcPescado]UUV42962.1 hypothetical protein RCAQUA_87 [Rhodobacter phage RcAqua]UUV43159.1 hypothetical protein RCBIGEAGLE_87 [Rhodobacter phage RcBigEagle]UUV43457.1 hypothetical protein RCEXPLORER_88 [Rhodobacter phage RcExplorer]UUV44131.1 hypothetical protein RCMAEVE_86 [Rhodobacter phage RcMaeve]UUV44659.1 hypothetical protein RCPACIFIC_86 [Rhodobacter pha
MILPNWIVFNGHRPRAFFRRYRIIAGPIKSKLYRKPK